MISTLSTPSGHFEDFRSNYQFAVKAAVVDQQFAAAGAAAAHLAAANIQPVHRLGPGPGGAAPVPPQGCVSLAVLAPGRIVLSNDGEASGVVAQGICLEPFELLHADVQRGGVAGQPVLLAALQQLYRELDMSGLGLVVTELGELPQPARLGDFCRLQRNHRDSVMDLLANDWTIKVWGRRGGGMTVRGPL